MGRIWYECVMMKGNDLPVASAAIVAAFPASPAATAAEEALLEVPEVVGVLARLDTDVVGLISDVTFVASCSRRRPTQ